MDVSDVKKLLQALSKAPIEGKIVGARESLANRELIVNAANEARLRESWKGSGIHDEEQAYNDMLSGSYDQEHDNSKLMALRKDLSKAFALSDKERTGPVSGRSLVDDAVVKLQPQLAAQAPVKVTHPFNPKEVFQFPAGTDEKTAKDLVRQIILKRVKEGEEKIDLPSNLPGEKPPLDTSEK